MSAITSVSSIITSSFISPFLPSQTSNSAIPLKTPTASSPINPQIIYNSSFSIQKVPLENRLKYCLDQTDFCANLCNTQVSSNTCSPNSTSLSWSCVCSDGKMPTGINATAYPATYHFCDVAQQGCINSCGPLTDCISKCRADYVCGKQDWDCSVAKCKGLDKPMNVLPSVPSTPGTEVSNSGVKVYITIISMLFLLVL